MSASLTGPSPAMPRNGSSVNEPFGLFGKPSNAGFHATALKPTADAVALSPIPNARVLELGSCADAVETNTSITAADIAACIDVRVMLVASNVDDESEFRSNAQHLSRC